MTMDTETKLDLGRVAYEAFAKRIERSHGYPALQDWKQICDAEKMGWVAASDAVIETARGTQAPAEPRQYPYLVSSGTLVRVLAGDDPQLIGPLEQSLHGLISIDGRWYVLDEYIDERTQALRRATQKEINAALGGQHA